ncbi:SIMPL domain-containing protein [Candidatus Bathyarchaeota archaeon]|nr:SIMPL domain-containing protein [Candidatus Bathyarchaeota archaeon]MBS7631599.1 SIMPL domain-containing protein [Candidatus Bathyarchaeota archaeon]
MNKQYIPIIAICASIILGMAIIAYQPQRGAQADYRFPVGIPQTLGSISATTLGDQQYKTITLTGSGSASAKADEATLTLGVQTEGPHASEASKKNAELMTKVINAIKDLGLEDEDIETVSYTISPVYDSDYLRVVGYRVVNLVNAKIRDLDLIGKVLDEASEAGANRIDGVSFGLSSPLAESLKLKAYKKALEDASSKAKVISEELSLKITGVLYVSESVYYPYSPYRGYSIAEKSSTPIFQGSLSVSVSVQIIYSFE